MLRLREEKLDRQKHWALKKPGDDFQHRLTCSIGLRFAQGARRDRGQAVAFVEAVAQHLEELRVVCVGVAQALSLGDPPRQRVEVDVLRRSHHLGAHNQANDS